MTITQIIKLFLASNINFEDKEETISAVHVSGQTVIPDQCESVIKGMIPVHQKPLL